jgi:hypothetical protein
MNFILFIPRTVTDQTHNTQPTNELLFILDIIYYNLCKPVQHVSIPSWDHHQGLLREYDLHKQN